MKKPEANLSIRVRLTERRRAKLDSHVQRTEKTISQLINDFIDSLPDTDSLPRSKKPKIQKPNQEETNAA